MISLIHTTRLSNLLLRMLIMGNYMGSGIGCYLMGPGKRNPVKKFDFIRELHGEAAFGPMVRADNWLFYG